MGISKDASIAVAAKTSDFNCKELEFSVACIIMCFLSSAPTQLGISLFLKAPGSFLSCLLCIEWYMTAFHGFPDEVASSFDYLGHIGNPRCKLLTVVVKGSRVLQNLQKHKMI